LKSDGVKLTDIRFEKTFSYYFFHTLIISFIISIFALIINIFFSSTEIIFYLFIVFGCIFVFLLSFSLYILKSSENSVKSLKNQQYPENLNINAVDHDGFIIIHSMDYSDQSIYSGLKILINFFQSNSFPFKIYHCFNPDEFKTVLMNNHVKYVWIFGHGWRGGVVFKWKKNPFKLFKRKITTILPYHSLNTTLYPKKKFICQLHCNNICTKCGDNTPLIPLLLINPTGNKNYFITTGYNNSFSIWYSLRKIVKNLKRNAIIVEI